MQVTTLWLKILKVGLCLKEQPETVFSNRPGYRTPLPKCDDDSFSEAEMWSDFTHRVLAYNNHIRHHAKFF